MIVDATRIETTRGSYMGEEGTGYRFGAPTEPGDFSERTRGHLQGSNNACRLEILVDGAEIVDTEYGTFLAVPAGTRDSEGWLVSMPVMASEAIERGLARVVA
jgi:hypothetical protein